MPCNNSCMHSEYNYHLMSRRVVLRFILSLCNSGEPVSFRLGVRPAPNFPLDLYLLMDLSASMNDDLTNLKNLGGSIGKKFLIIDNINATCFFGLQPIQSEPLLLTSLLVLAHLLTRSYLHLSMSGLLGTNSIHSCYVIDFKLYYLQAC